MLRGARAIVIPWCVYHVTQSIKSAKVVGFCDASSKVYAAVVYVRLEGETCVDVKFLHVAAKARVALLGGTTIPRLELLSALLLSKLMDSVHVALKPELSISEPVCFTDSKAALFWIQGVSHEWKQFVENRVTTIRCIIRPQNWRHCPGKENPADIPSRGMSPSTLVETPTWLNGPDWLYSESGLPEEREVRLKEIQVPDDCRTEMRCKEAVHSLINVEGSMPGVSGLSELIDLERYSSSHRLFRVTALVLKFVHCLRSQARDTAPLAPPKTLLTTGDIDQARLHWIKDSQSHLQRNGRFPSWRCQLDLFKDESGVWRCGRRMSRSSLSPAAKHQYCWTRNII